MTWWMMLMAGACLAVPILAWVISDGSSAHNDDLMTGPQEAQND